MRFFHKFCEFSLIFAPSAVLVNLVQKLCVFLVHKPCLSVVAVKFQKKFFGLCDPRVPISVIFQFFRFFFICVWMCAGAGIKRAGAGIERGTVRDRAGAGACGSGSVRECAGVCGSVRECAGA